MKSLENLTISQRITLTFVIVMIVLFVAAFVGWSMGRWEAASQSLILTLSPSKWDAEIIQLDKQAVKEAYVAKIRQLYDVWVREGRDNPERPMKGAAEARRAYIELMK